MDMRRDLDRHLNHRQPRSVDAHRDGFERPADPVAACHTCGRGLHDGDTCDTHTRTLTVHGPPFCQECSEAISEWVPWPCDGDRARREVRYECEACACPNDHGPDGVIACWSPGGPCALPDDPACETCGPCFNCTDRRMP